MQEAADAATSGQTLYDGEGRKARDGAEHARRTRAAKTRVRRPFTLKGSLTFATPKEAEAARAAMMRAAGELPGVVADGRTLRFALQREAPLGVITGIGEAVQEMLGAAKKGKSG